ISGWLALHPKRHGIDSGGETARIVRQHLAAFVIDANDPDLRRARPHGFQHRNDDGLARPGRHFAEDRRAAAGRDRAIDAGGRNGGADGAARHGDGGERHRALRSIHAGGHGALRTGGAKAEPATNEIDGCGSGNRICRYASHAAVAGSLAVRGAWYRRTVTVSPTSNDIKSSPTASGPL